MNIINYDTQLAYVLPHKSLHLLKKDIRDKLINNLKEYYSSSPTFTWAFCKYFWESHLDLPEIPIPQLEKLVN